MNVTLITLSSIILSFFSLLLPPDLCVTVGLWIGKKRWKQHGEEEEEEAWRKLKACRKLQMNGVMTPWER